MQSSMSDEKFVQYIRLLLRYQARHEADRRIYDDDVLHVEETQDGVKVRTKESPRRLILNWKRTGLFYEAENRTLAEDAHLEKLVVLYAMAQDLF